MSKKSDASADDGSVTPAKASRTTITPQPGSAPEPDSRGPVVRRRRGDAFARPDLTTARPPIPGARLLRLGVTGMVFLASSATAAGAVLMVLLWLQHRDSGVLTTQVDRAWELFDHLRTIERLVAYATVPVSAGWVMLATLNVRRATGHRRNPAAAAAALVVAIGGIWFVGAEMVAPAETWIDRGVGIVFQAVFVALLLLVLERLAEAAEARRRGLHVTAVIAVAYLAQLQCLGGVSNTERTVDPKEWGLLGAYLVIGALLQALGALAVNEAARAIEEGADHRYELRSRFGESLLAQAALDHQIHI